MFSQITFLNYPRYFLKYTESYQGTSAIASWSIATTPGNYGSITYTGNPTFSRPSRIGSLGQQSYSGQTGSYVFRLDHASGGRPDSYILDSFTPGPLFRFEVIYFASDGAFAGEAHYIWESELTDAMMVSLLVAEQAGASTPDTIPAAGDSTGWDSTGIPAPTFGPGSGFEGKARGGVLQRDNDPGLGCVLPIINRPPFLPLSLDSSKIQHAGLVVVRNVSPSQHPYNEAGRCLIYVTGRHCVRTHDFTGREAVGNVLSQETVTMPCPASPVQILGQVDPPTVNQRVKRIAFNQACS